MKPFRHFPRDAHEFARHFFLRNTVFEYHAGFQRETSRHHNEGAVIVHAQRRHFKGGRLALERHMNFHSHSK